MRRVPFVMMARSMGSALAAGELSTDAVAMWVGMACASDPQTLEFVGTLDEIRRLCGLGKKGADQLSRHLRALRDGGWIAFESRPGQRKPYRVQILDLRTPSARPPHLSTPNTRRLTSASAEVVGGANSYEDRGGPPHDLRTRGGGGPAREELEVENGVVTSTETDELDAVLAPLGLTQMQAKEAVRAWQESPAGVEREVQHALANGERPAALFMSRIRDGAHRHAAPVPSDESEAFVRSFPNYMRNVGCMDSDRDDTSMWEFFKDELAQEENRRRVELTDDQRRRLCDVHSRLFGWTSDPPDPAVPIERARRYVRNIVEGDVHYEWEWIWPGLERQLETVGVEVTQNLHQELFELFDEIANERRTSGQM